MLVFLRQICRPAVTNYAARTGLAITSARAHHTEQDPTYPYNYTSGRWLLHDKLRHEARYIKFDFPALCKKAVKTCPGATKVVRYEKREGGCNRVFILHLDNGQRVVARIPFRVAGPRTLMTNSEVATMAYVASFTKIPIPKVLDWSDNDDNSIGTEYIIMEHVGGVQLQDRWPSMSPHQHMLCVKKVALMVAELAKLPFPAYGSLYFADAPIDQKSKVEFAEGFCVGPHCGTQYWGCDPGEARSYEVRPPNRGPWFDLEKYCSGLIDTGFSRIPKNSVAVDDLPYRGSVQEHLRLLGISSKVIEELIKVPIVAQAATPVLLHPDLHKRNIYVSEEDPSCVTAVLDWQSASIEPTFVYAVDTPDLAEDLVADVPILENLMSPSEASLKPKAENPENKIARQKHEEDAIRCRKTFEVVLKGYAPVLHSVRAMDQTLLRPFRYCDASWRDSAAALRQELIELLQGWCALGLPGSCPYQPTAEEVREHAEQYEDFETVQQLKVFLMRALNVEADGWVTTKLYEAAKEQNQALFEEWKETNIKSGSGEDRAKKLWPFEVE